MADFQLSGNTVISESGGNVSWGPGVPPGTIKYIDHASWSGVGSIGDQQNWYPTDMSSDSAKTLYLAVPYSSYETFSKLKIEFSFDMRCNKDTHAFIDVRLVRWQGGLTAPSTTHDGETTLYKAASGVVSGGLEIYNAVSGNAIDEVSSLTGTIYYAIQYRNANANASYAAGMYASNTDGRHQMIVLGIY